MKLVSWNVNGLRACIQKGFLEQFDTFDADFFCLQETKLSEGQLELDLPGYEQYWCYAQKKGYSGTAIFTKHTPMSVQYGLGVPELDTEGRLITLEYPEFYLITCYTPNAQRELARIDHRMNWDEAFRSYLKKLDAIKPVILCGDLNVAHQEIDLKNPKSNRGSAGFSDQERESFQKTLDLGFTDTFRHLHPDKTGAYSWWSYMFKAREKNAGWRIDYFLISQRLQERLYRADIHSDVFGSDHCPVSVEMGLIVNGGLWSPMQQGKASQILPEEKTKKESNDAPKASAKFAKALVALLMIAGLIGTFFLWYEPPITDEPGISEKPFVTHVFEKQLSHVYLPPSGAPLQILQKDPNHLTDDAEHHYYIPIGISEGNMGNFCLRVDVSSFLQRRYGEAMTIEIKPMHPSTELNYAMIYRQYFTDSKYTQFDGWLVFGTLNQPIEFQITVTAGDQTYVDSVIISPIDRFQGEVPYFENACSVQTFTTPLSSVPSFSSDKNVNYITDGTDDFQKFVTDLYNNRDISQWNSWFYIELDPTVAKQLTQFELSLQTTIIVYGLEAAKPEYLYVSEVYSDPDCLEFTGWLVYGNLNPETSVQFRLCPDGTRQLIWDATTSAAPYLTRKEAADMSTEALFHFAAKHSGVQRFLEYNGTFTDLSEMYPFIEVLLDRTDAISTLMNGSIREFNEMLFARQLLQNCFLQDMTTKEEAIFWLGDYPTSPFPYWTTEIDPPDNISQIVTRNILHSALESYDFSLLPQCSTQEVAYQVFQYWLSNPYWAELVNRSDAVDAIAQLCSQDPSYQPLLALWNYLPMRIQASEMTAAALVDFILADPDRCASITCTGMELKAYAYSDLYISALLEKEDAVDALLNATVPAEGDARRVPTILLYGFFSEQMTAQQAAKFITGLHNSAATPFAFSLNYHLDLATASTGSLVSHLTHYGEELFGFLEAAYAYPEPDTVMYEVYQLLLPYSDILQELQTRPDTVADLRTEFAGTLVLNSPVGYLLHLYETYPVIWGGEIPATNALALKDASNWFVAPNTAAPDHLYLHGSFPIITISHSDYKHPLEDANFAYLVTFPSQYMTMDSETALSLEVSLQHTEALPEGSFIDSIPCYTDFSRTKFCGWLVYGKIDFDLSIYLTLYQDGKYTTACHFSPLEAPENVAGVRQDSTYDDIEVIIPE